MKRSILIVISIGIIGVLFFRVINSDRIGKADQSLAINSSILDRDLQVSNRSKKNIQNISDPTKNNSDLFISEVKKISSVKRYFESESFQFFIRILRLKKSLHPKTLKALENAKINFPNSKTINLVEDSKIHLQENKDLFNEKLHQQLVELGALESDIEILADIHEESINSSNRKIDTSEQYLFEFATLDCVEHLYSKQFAANKSIEFSCINNIFQDQIADSRVVLQTSMDEGLKNKGWLVSFLEKLSTNCPKSKEQLGLVIDQRCLDIANPKYHL